MADGIVERRLVFHVGGYDLMMPEIAHRRFVRELRRFETTWSLAASATPPVIDEDVAAWDVAASGPNWAVGTAIRLVRWDDVIARESREPDWRRAPRGILALADFVVGGAFWGYLRTAWRYGLFFIYPFAILAGFAALAIGAGLLTLRLGGAAWLGAPVGLLTFAASIRWIGPRLSLAHLLDDWIFSRRYLRRPDPILEPRLDRIAASLVAAAGGRGLDEIVVVGHSLGAVLAVELMDRAIRLDPGLGTTGPRVALVTAGSSIPKLGLHRAALRLREATGRVSEARGLFWVDYQALTDAMNFYKTNPARLLGASAPGPLLRTVRISRMLDPAYYRRIKQNFFRVHNQFVSANDRRAPYDYFMLLCGPVPIEAQARSREGAETRIDLDGNLMTATAEVATLLRGATENGR